MATMTKQVIPGAGEVFDFTVEDADGNVFDISEWTVTATIVDVLGLLSPLALMVVPNDTSWSVVVTGAQTAARAGGRHMVKAVGRAPIPALPAPLVPDDEAGDVVVAADGTPAPAGINEDTGDTAAPIVQEYLLVVGSI